MSKIFFSIGYVGFLLLSCVETDSTPEVSFDTAFESSRLDSIQKIRENEFTALVLPENEPINKSPWYAFAVSAKDERTIKITLDYGEYQHRYVPKMSYDKVHWRSLEDSKIKVDTAKHTAILQLEISPRKLYVSAQEIITSADTYLWTRRMVKERQEIQFKAAGKTVLDNDNYIMSYEKKEVKNTIVLIARQHPPEIPGGTIGFQSFYETLFSNTELANAFRDKFNIYTFPLLNPDGTDLGNWRHNANGTDLNRDWVEFTQPETQMVRDFVKNKVAEGKKIDFAIDFHTSHSGPYLLVLDSINEAKTKKIIPDWIKKIESNSHLKVEARRRSQNLPYCYNFFYNTYGTEAVTYEDGDEVDREIIKDKARIYATHLMQVLLEKTDKISFNE